MNIQELIKSIKNGDLSHSNYLLFGEEDFFIDKIETAFLKYLIPDEEKSFNQKIFYGKDIDVYSLMSTLKSFPMIGKRQLIMLKEADKMDKIDALETYLNNPVPTSIFIMCYHKKSIDKRKKWIKLFKHSGFLFESKKVYDYQISKFIQMDLVDLDLKIDRSAELLLVNHLGLDLSKISNAITKLSKIVSGKVIRKSDVQEHIGIHREYNNFELHNALASRDIKKIVSISSYFASNQNKFPLPPIVGGLFSFFSKLLMVHGLKSYSDKEIVAIINVHPYFLSNYKIGCSNYSFDDCLRIISILKDYDLEFKGLRKSSSDDLLKDLIFDIIFF